MADKNKDVGFWGPFLPKFGEYVMDGIFGDEGETTGEQVFGFDSYDYKGLPEGATYKDYINELQKSRDLSLYSRYDGDKQEAIKKEGDEIRADINRLFPDRKKNDRASMDGRPNMRDVAGDAAGNENKAALTAGLIKKTEAEQAERDRKLEEEEAFRDTPRGRMQTMFNDADKRDAILGGIADAMLETRTGADAYGNRFARAQRNVRDNLKVAEATDIARQKAQLDAMKTMAETNKLVDPRQYMTDAQAEASSIIRAQIRAGKIKAEDYDTEYAKMLKQIAVKDLTSAKASSISTLFTYAQALQATDPVTAGILMDAIKSNAIYLAGDGASGEVITETIDATTLK
tara:strand:+ start:565 stop:1599 length:1035 start_codon:yes stop_codon:yes gene_type:complete